jgi:hypothetical protein
METGTDAVDIGHTIHPHPTLSETIGMAAERSRGRSPTSTCRRRRSIDEHPAALCAPRPDRGRVPWQKTWKRCFGRRLNQRDLSLAYSPGVAYACPAIRGNPFDAATLTLRANLVAVVSNGTEVLASTGNGITVGPSWSERPSPYTFWSRLRARGGSI